MSTDLDPSAQPGPRSDIAVGRPAAPTLPIGPRAPSPWGGPRVVAVVVSHDGEDVLPRTIGAVLAQDRPADVVVAADLESRDGSRRVVQDAGVRLLPLPSGTGLGAAVTRAAESLDGDVDVRGDRPAGDPEGRATEWLWLLPQGTAPAPDALRRLLDVVDAGPSIGVAGAKQVDWDDERHLLDVGFSVSRFGGRVTGIDVDDTDQGQLDDRSDVLAVSAPGLLVRRDLWDRLGGLDPALSRARDALDLCRRAHLAGARVVVVPAAVVARSDAHLVTEPGRDRRRAAPWRADDLADAVHLRLAAAPWYLLPLVLLGLVPVSLARALGWVALKRPRRALDALVTPLVVVLLPWRWRRARRRRRRAQVVPTRTLRTLRADSRQTVRQRRDAVAAYLREHQDSVDLRDAPAPPVPVAAAPAPPAPPAPPPAAMPPAEARPPAEAWPGLDEEDLDTIDGAALPPLLGHESALGAASAMLTRAAATAPGAVRPADLAATGDHPAPGTRAARREEARREAAAQLEAARTAPPTGAARWIALALTAAVVTVAGVVALRPVLTGPGTLTGPGLLPAPAGAGSLWGAARSWFRDVGLGVTAPADPVTGLLAALATATGGSARHAVTLLLVLALPLAAASAWWAAGALTRSRALRCFAALSWAAAPSLLASVASGRLGPVLAHLLLPVAALALARTVAGTVATPPAGLLARPVLVPGGSLAAASAAGLLATLTVAAAPSLAVPLLLAVLTTALAVRRARPRLLWTLVLPVLLLAPWVVAVLADPRLLVAGAATGTRAAAEAPGAGAGWWHLLLPADPGWLPSGALPGWVQGLIGGPVAPVVLALVLLAPLPVLAAAAALRTDRPARGPLVLAVAGLSGLAVAAATPWLGSLGLEREAVPLGPVALGLPRYAPAAAGLPAWAGPGVSLVLLALLAALLWRLDGAAARLRRRDFGRPQLVAALTGILLVLGPVLGLAQWTVQGATGAGAPVAAGGGWLTRAEPDVLPAVAAVEASGPARVRTLVLRQGADGVTWSLLGQAGPRLGETSAAAVGAAAGRTPSDEDLVLPVVSGLLSGGGQDQRAALADLAVGSVLLLGPVPEDAEAGIEASPGLVRVATPDGGVLWRVDQDGVVTRPSRVRVLDAAGATLLPVPSSADAARVTLPPGEAGRTLVLADRADAGWRATLEGRELTPTVHSRWAQAFELPATGGRLELHHTTAVERADAARLGIALVALLLAVPLPHWRRRWIARLADTDDEAEPRRMTA